MMNETDFEDLKGYSNNIALTVVFAVILLICCCGICCCDGS